MTEVTIKSQTPFTLMDLKKAACIFFVLQRIKAIIIVALKRT